MTTYATLKTDIITWLARPDISESLAESFIRLAEADIRADVRVRVMETTDDDFVLQGLETPLPDGWLQFKAVSLDVANQRPLDFTTPALLRQSALIDSGSYPRQYAIEGTNILVAPASAGSEIVIVYYKAFDALSTENTTNWLLTNAYNVYLFGALKHAHAYLEDDAQEAKYEAKYRDFVARLNREHKMSAWGPSPKSFGARSTP